MLDTTSLWIIVIIVILLPFLWNIRSFFVRISGSWYEEKEETRTIQMIQLRQIGPVIWGIAKVNGGQLRYSGWFNGKELKIRRKDFGKNYLASLGFPKEVLRELDGSEMARMIFQYDPIKKELKGKHFPQKIEISRTRPPKIMQRIYLPARSRTWTKTKPHH